MNLYARDYTVAVCYVDYRVMRIGYARCSTASQDVAEQIDQLIARDVARDQIHTDKGFTGTNRDRPGLDKALTAVRAGDTLVVTKLDRLARSASDLAEIGRDLESRGVRLEYGGQLYNPDDPFGKVMFQMLGVFAEFEADLLHQRTREGVARAKAAGKYKGRKPKRSAKQRRHMWELYDKADWSVPDIAEMFELSVSGTYKYLRREKDARRPDDRKD